MNPTISLHPHQARDVFDKSHSIILSIGGLGSGKTTADALWLIDRAQWDQSQLHGLFANSVVQLETGVLAEIKLWLERAGIEYEYYHQPPKAWREEWRRRGIVVPPRPANHRRMLVTRTGLHVLCGTLSGQTYRQYRSLQFGSATIEEVTAGISQQAIEFVIERVRCGQRATCAAKHRHQVRLVGNPPDMPDHWLFSWLDRAEQAAARKVGQPEEAREPGTYPLLTAGAGSMVLIQSSTYDNSEFLNENYASNLAENYDRETAKRRLGGELIRISTGRAAESFSAKNIYPVAYDPTRTLWVMLDFDLDPAVAAFGHPLKHGEYPSEHEREGREVVGIFGELVITGGISVRRLAEAIVRGDRGSGLDYRDEGLRGLPANWAGLRGHKTRFVAFGDATGNQRSKAADNLESSWQIVGEIFGQVRDEKGQRLYSKDVAEFNDSPRARFHAFNARCESATGIVSFYADPRAEQFLKDTEQCTWDVDGVTLKKWSKRAGGDLYARGHLLDAVSYPIQRRYPLGADRQPTAALPLRGMPNWNEGFKRPPQLI